ncbi:hypothetical protein [Streptosporangium sp. NPDC049644]|uniref:hypothetical protein n=1 Tax=Streptosporangium sp. NPDC049644 TaxID=3155507 RepID=UPI0034130867
MRETPEELKELQALLDACLPRSVYGDDAFDWDDDVVRYRPHPHWTTVYAPDIGKLTAASRS